MKKTFKNLLEIIRDLVLGGTFLYGMFFVLNWLENPLGTPETPNNPDCPPMTFGDWLASFPILIVVVFVFILVKLARFKSITEDFEKDKLP